MIHDWAALTTRQLSALDLERAVAVLPLGATEQHGPHLPLSTDSDIAEGLLDAAAELVPEDVTVLRLPVLSVGTSAEHGAFAGTLSVAAETMADVLRSIGDHVAGTGVRRLVLLNAHGGNLAPIDIAALDLRRERQMLVVKLHYPRLSIDPGPLTRDETVHGVHGGALETAIMCHLQPDRVQHDQFPSTRPSGNPGYRVGPTQEARTAWLAEDLHPSGVTGDPSRGDAELGAHLVAAYGAAIAEVIAETAALATPGSG